MNALEAKARELGFKLSDLIGGKKRRERSGSTGPKYRHPENPEVAWSGRGRKPGWFIDALRRGRSRMRWRSSLSDPTGAAAKAALDGKQTDGGAASHSQQSSEAALR